MSFVDMLKGRKKTEPAPDYIAARRARQEARSAAAHELAAVPHYIDLLAGLPALAGRQASITPLGPTPRFAEALGVGGLSPEIYEEAGLKPRKGEALVVEEVPPSRGIQGAWEHLQAQGVVVPRTKSGKPAIPASTLAYGDKQVVEALGHDVIVALRDGTELVCDLDGCEEPAFTVCWPNRLLVCEPHLLEGVK